MAGKVVNIHHIKYIIQYLDEDQGYGDQDLSAMIPIAKEIDEYGYKIDLDSFESTKVSKLHMGAIFGENQVAKDLIQNGIGVHTQTKRKITPLHLAVVFHRNEIVGILLENGANPVIKVGFFQKSNSL